MEDNNNKPKIPKWAVGLIFAVIAVVMFVSVIFKIKYYGP